MARPSRPQKFLAGAMLITFVLAFVPAKWLRWTSDIADVVSFPMMPFQDFGIRLASWLRPEAPVTATPSEQRLIEETDRFKRLWRAEQARVQELEQQVEQLQRIPAEHRLGVRPILAHLVERNPRAGDGTLRINRGTRHGVEPGTIAVYRGVHLVGRVIEGVSTITCRVEPITAIDLIGARILSREDPEMRLEDAPAVQLRAQRDGTFLVDSLARDQPVRPGDLLVLDDRQWPSTAQGMILGEVDSVTPNDRDALRSIVIIEPVYRLRNLPMVTLHVERFGEHAWAADEGGDR